jgi:predicted phosphodiesterase
MKTYAIISDIHGNSLALLAVLKDINSRGIETIINLGDHCFGALEPESAAMIIREKPMYCISGNTDREIVESYDMPSEKENMAHVRKEISSETLDWLKALSKTRVIDDLFFVCHGTPESDNEYLLEKVTEHGVFVYNDEELMEKTAHIKQRIVLCGHSHVNRVIYLTNNKIILNPGSVGLPAYLGTGEYSFAMESNSPHAKYAIVHANGNDINIEQVLCAYNWDAASAAAKNNGSEKWAQYLLYGRMPKDLRIH